MKSAIELLNEDPIWQEVDDDNLTKRALVSFAERYATQPKDQKDEPRIPCPFCEEVMIPAMHNYCSGCGWAPKGTKERERPIKPQPKDPCTSHGDKTYVSSKGIKCCSDCEEPVDGKGLPTKELGGAMSNALSVTSILGEFDTGELTFSEACNDLMDLITPSTDDKLREAAQKVVNKFDRFKEQLSYQFINVLEELEKALKK